MRIVNIFFDNTNGQGIIGLGVDNRLYVWNYKDAVWDLLKKEVA